MISGKTHIPAGHGRRVSGSLALRWGAAGLLYAMLSFPSSPALAASDVLRIRTGLHPDTTRLVVDLSERATWQASVTDGGRQLVIRIDDARLASFAPKPDLQGLVAEARATTVPGTRSVEIAITLTEPAHIKRQFVMDADVSRPARLIVDLKAGYVAPEPAPKTTPEPAPVMATESGESQMPESAPVETAPVTVPAQPSAPTSQPAEASSGFDAPPPPPPTQYQDDRGYEVDFSGSIEAEGRWFPEKSAHFGPPGQTGSFAIDPKLDMYWKGGDSILTVAPFARVDLIDSARTHWDIRELKWVGVFDPFEIRIGVDKAFWGVTESVHLVDIVNQDDLLEDIDSEDKLGQPMVALTVDTGFGFLTGYALPYFRERQFPGYRGRPAGPLRVDEDQVRFGSGDNNWHADWALRWSQVMGPLDVGLSFFSGFDRDPRFTLGLNSSGGAVLVPNYDLIDQAGIDVQGTFGAMLVKFEAIHQWNDFEDFTALAGGFEYTFYGIGGGASDIGVLAEYLYDDRGRFGPSPFEKDLFVGFRWSANDVASTTILAGAIFDLNESTTLVNIEASRRIGDDWKISLDLRLFPDVDPWDPLSTFVDDDFVQLRIARYF